MTPGSDSVGSVDEADEADEADKADEDDRPTERFLDNIWAPKRGFSLSILLCFGGCFWSFVRGVLWSKKKQQKTNEKSKFQNLELNFLKF